MGATCSGDVNNCLTCVSGFTFRGSKCISNFNFQLNTVFNVNITVFNSNYLSFISDIASAASTTIDKVSVISLIFGSVNAVVQISTTNAANSQAAINQQNALSNAVNSGTLGNMQVTSSLLPQSSPTLLATLFLMPLGTPSFPTLPPLLPILTVLWSLSSPRTWLMPGLSISKLLLMPSSLLKSKPSI